MVNVLRYAASVPQKKADIFIYFNAHVGSFEFKCHDLGWDVSKAEGFKGHLYIDECTPEEVSTLLSDLKLHVDAIRRPTVAEAMRNQAQKLRDEAEELAGKADELLEESGAAR